MSDMQEYKDGDNPEDNVIYTPPEPGGDPSPEDKQRIKDVGGETLSPDTPATQLEKAVVGHTRGVDPSEVRDTRPPDLSERPEGPHREPGTPPFPETAPEGIIPGEPPTPEGEPPAGPPAPEGTIPGEPPTPEGEPPAGPPAPPAPGTQP